MKTCPFCDQTNEEDAFYCRQCNRPIADVSGKSDPSSYTAKSDLKLADDDSSPFSGAKPGSAVREPESPQHHARPAGRHGEDQVTQLTEFDQQAFAKPRSRFLTLFLLALVVIFGGTLAYIVFVLRIVEQKQFFDQKLAEITAQHVERVASLNTEIQILRVQRDNLAAELGKSEEKYKVDTQSLQERLNELVERRLPGTLPVRFEEPAVIREDGMKYTIEFLPSPPAEKVLRYRINLENTQRSPLSLSSADLLVFNENGLQIAASSISDIDGVARQSIASGETRVIMGSVRFTPKGKPSFFLFQSGS